MFAVNHGLRKTPSASSGADGLRVTLGSNKRTLPQAHCSTAPTVTGKVDENRISEGDKDDKVVMRTGLGTPC